MFANDDAVNEYAVMLKNMNKESFFERRMGIGGNDNVDRRMDLMTTHSMGSMHKKAINSEGIKSLNDRRKANPKKVNCQADVMSGELG